MSGARGGRGRGRGAWGVRVNCGAGAVEFCGLRGALWALLEGRSSSNSELRSRLRRLFKAHPR